MSRSRHADLGDLFAGGAAAVVVLTIVVLAAGTLLITKEAVRAHIVATSSGRGPVLAKAFLLLAAIIAAAVLVGTLMHTAQPAVLVASLAFLLYVVLLEWLARDADPLGAGGDLLEPWRQWRPAKAA
jgi:hypothetical protein